MTTTDVLDEEWKGYVVQISGGNDKSGFPMKQGNKDSWREKVQILVGGCVLGEQRGGYFWTHRHYCTTVPMPFGPQRAGKVHKACHLSKEDDISQY
ncbi:hypothetical protein A6R68_07033, partial [Neotoma lepida]